MMKTMPPAKEDFEFFMSWMLMIGFGIKYQNLTYGKVPRHMTARVGDNAKDAKRVQLQFWWNGERWMSRRPRIAIWVGHEEIANTRDIFVIWEALMTLGVDMPANIADILKKNLTEKVK